MHLELNHFHCRHHSSRSDDNDDDDNNNNSSICLLMITSLVNKHQRHLCIAWIDYTKAIDSLCHNWIVTVTEKLESCRMCCNTEHTEHTVAGCTTLPPPEYTNRHNKVACYIHWTVCKYMGYRLLTSTVNIYLRGS